MFNYFKSRNYSSKKINKIYSQYLYTGVHGILMRYCHRQLENKLPDKKFKRILEIGAGSQPHLPYIKSKDFTYFILEKSKYKPPIKKIKSQKIFYKYYNGKKIPYKPDSFDRIILSQTLEHIPDPQSFLNQAMKILKKGGVLSISLPVDPGLFYRICRTINKIFISKLKMSGLEYDYSNAIEHINSIYNLVNIIRYNYRGKIKENFLPFKIRLLDFNLFYNVHIVK